MLPINAETLYSVAGHTTPRQKEIVDEIGPRLAETLAHWGIVERLDIAHFIGQTCHESDRYSTTSEYASGVAYEGRIDLGNTEPGDGVKFRGHGLIQTTGRANHKRAADKLGIPFERIVEHLKTPIGALESACLFWKDNGLTALALRDDVLGVTRRVNGGTNGLVERRIYTSIAKSALAEMAGGAVKSAHPGIIVLARGSFGDDVETLQRALSAAGYPVAIDGEFGAATELAVLNVQRQHQLTKDGIVGPQTWAVLMPQGA